MCLAAAVAGQCALGTNAAVATVWTATAVRDEVHGLPVEAHRVSEEEPQGADGSTPSTLDAHAQGARRSCFSIDLCNTAIVCTAVYIIALLARLDKISYPWVAVDVVIQSCFRLCTHTPRYKQLHKRHRVRAQQFWMSCHKESRVLSAYLAENGNPRWVLLYQSVDERTRDCIYLQTEIS